MSESDLNPAADIIRTFGGVRATARIAGVNPAAVSRWKAPRERRGTNGLIPQRHWQRLLDHAKSVRIRLTLRDLSGL